MQDRKYLQKRGSTHYARVIVPQSARAKLGGKTHLRRTLGTASLPEANRRKLAVVGELKKVIERAKHGTDWKDWREDLRKAMDPDEKDAIEFRIQDEAEALAEKAGLAVAKEFYAKATQTAPSLSELAGTFLGLSEHSVDTLRKHQKAVGELVNHFHDRDLPPKQIAPEDLLKFTDSLIERDLAPNTLRDRLSSLGTFWAWLERRLHAPRGENPFRGHSVKGGTVEASRAFTDGEVDKVLTSRFPEDWQRHAFVIILLTGARPNEILGLRHRDIDILNRTVSIAKAKTDAGIRTLPYRHPLLAAAFQAVVKVDAAAKDTRVFPQAGPDDKPAKNFINFFSRHRQRLGLPEGATLYSARKCFISRCLDLGADVVNVERYIGHKNPRLALSTYSKGRSDVGLVKVAEALATGWKLNGP